MSSQPLNDSSSVDWLDEIFDEYEMQDLYMTTGTSNKIKAQIAQHVQEAVVDARLDENSTIHKWVQKPSGYDTMSTKEQYEWVISTLGNIGSYLDARQKELTNTLPAKGKK